MILALLLQLAAALGSDPSGRHSSNAATPATPPGYPIVLRDGTIHRVTRPPKPGLQIQKVTLTDGTSLYLRLEDLDFDATRRLTETPVPTRTPIPPPPLAVRAAVRRPDSTPIAASRLLPEAPPTPVPFSRSFTGTGEGVTARFLLPRGVYLIELLHRQSEGGNFVVELVDPAGTPQLLANDLGAYQGDKVVTIPREGSYTLDVKADGSWSVTIRERGPGR